MLFLGDLAIPGSRLSSNFAPAEGEIVAINCEGYLVGGDMKASPQAGVFNNVDAISDLDWPHVLLNLANNHVMDAPDGAERSLEIGKSKGYQLAGAGENLAAASQNWTERENGVDVTLICVGWDVIGCKIAGPSRQGVSPLDSTLVIERIKQAAAKRTDGGQIVIFAHWGYETERYPLPVHREMAYAFVKAGADLVIGCHAHCVQGYERVDGKAIFYGLGNFAFAEHHYLGGKLAFPDYCRPGIAVRWNPENGDIEVAKVDYRQDRDFAEFGEFSSAEAIDLLEEYSKFAGMDHAEYRRYFRQVRYKRKGLPVLEGSDQSLKYAFLKSWIGLRHQLVLLVYRARSALRRQ